MLNCISDIIGLKHCKYKKPYLKDLSSQAGISVEALDNLADSEQEQFLGVFEQIKERGIDRLTTSLLTAEVTPKGSGYNNCFGVVDKDYIWDISLGGDVGVYFKAQNLTMHVLKINHLVFYSASDTSQTITFIIKDLVFNTILLTLTTTVEKGVNTIPLSLEINTKETSGELFIGYSNANILYYDTTPDFCSSATFTTNSGCVPCGQSSSSSSADIEEFPLNSKTTSGISVDYSIVCSLEKIVCNLKQQFALPLYYATSIEFIYERLGSSRLNKFALFKDDVYEKLLKEFEVLYEKSIGYLVKSAIFSNNECFSCKNTDSYIYKI